MDKACFLLIVNNGAPYETGYEIPLSENDMLLGRPWKNHQPHIPFTSPYISKNHALITTRDEHTFIQDLHSKHGILLNGTQLIPGQDYLLNAGDYISLAKEVVLLRFSRAFDAEAEKTRDLDTSQNGDIGGSQSLLIDPVRRKVHVDGIDLRLYGKGLDLLLLLYRNRNQAVNYNEIKLVVWSERPLEGNGIPIVGNDEINALVYRLRKRLGDYGFMIGSVPHFGYRLDIEM